MNSSIETLRLELNKLVILKNKKLTSPEVIALSQKLDILVIDEMRKKMEKVKKLVVNYG